ncbi:hypothetical protein [Demequina litorisediminis]|uniref:PH domain-containing protein n=1 Tax=Demequina litorisediminis TaxID=1849022 RepID=A0ABQ6IIF3_9MICO|nr:hypothetical protein [Demequina litorisediminis]GMA36931.1 hypothetical protein GCM10025876_31350 [Demequina litorisediminis]
MTDFVTTVRVRSTPATATGAGSPALLYGAVGVAAAVAGGIAMGGDLLAQRLTAAGVALALALALGYLRALMHATSSGRVRVRTQGPLTFVPPTSLDRWPLLLAAVALLPAATALAIDASQFSDQGSIWLGIFTLAGFAWLVQQALARRTPVGLELADAGLRGVRGAASVDLTWEQVEGASARASGKDGVLVIAGSTAVTINGSRLGSDPAVIAAVIEHFRMHPEDRPLLATPREALRVVEDAQPG